MPPAQTHVPVQRPQDWPTVNTRDQLLNLDPGYATAALRPGDRQHVQNEGVTYVCADPTIPATWFPAAPVPLWQWNGVDATQFALVGQYNGPTAPVLQYVADPTVVGGGYLSVELGLGTPGGAAAVWQIIDPSLPGPVYIPFESMRLRWLQTPAPDAIIVPPDDLFVGFIVACDIAGALGVVFSSGTDTAGADAFLNTVANGPGLGFAVGTQPLASSAVRVNEVEINGDLRDQAGFPPMGVPAYVATARITQLGVASEDTLFVASPASPYNAGSWAAAGALNVVGIIAFTTSGNAGNGKLRLGMLSIERSERGYP